MRALGQRVVYEPASVVVHYEGMSAGTDMTAGMKRFQVINQAKFAAKWATVLKTEHLAARLENVFRAARLRHRHERAVLVIDSYVPLYDKEAGSNRLKRLVNGMRDAGLRIVFLPDNLMAIKPYAQQLQSDGVEVVYQLEDHRRPWQEFLVEVLQDIDVAWVCRPNLFCKYVPTIRAHSPIPVLYDTIDLHHLRQRRQAETQGTSDEVNWRKTERLELACANAADRTIVVSDYEEKLLRAAGIEDIAVIPTVHDIEMSRSLGYAKTSGLLFIGGYNHQPNVDAVIWLVREIMPLLWDALPDLVVTLLGSNPPQSVCDLASERVIVPGFVQDHDVAAGFRSARVFVAPLRFGAGLKGKIGQALGFGTPIVSTSVGVEGFGLIHEVNALVADDRKSFAAAVLRVYENADLWEVLSAASAAALGPFASRHVVANALAVIDSALERSCDSRAAFLQSDIPEVGPETPEAVRSRATLRSAA